MRLLVAALILLTVQTAEAGPAMLAQPDYCPELNRSPEYPEGDRVCDAGCIYEDAFFADNAISTIDKWADDFWGERSREGAWEYDVGTHDAMVVSEGAILRLRMLLAKQALNGDNSDTNAAEYERHRARYCEFLRTAGVLD